MYSYQLWIELRESISEPYEQSDLLAQAQLVVTDWLADHSNYGPITSDRNCRLGLVGLNGFPRVVGFGVKNHHRGEQRELLDLFDLVARAAPGSFGELRSHDDENPSTAAGWTLHLLRRGRLEQVDDPFFSPMAPTVEDADDSISGEA